MSERVRHLGPKPSQLGYVLTALARHKLEKRPDLLDGHAGVARVVATDSDMAVTIEIRDSQLRISEGDQTPADVIIAAKMVTLSAFPSIPRRFGLLDPLSRAGRAALLKLFTGELKIKGLVRHTSLVRLLTTVLDSRP